MGLVHILLMRYLGINIIYRFACRYHRISRQSPSKLFILTQLTSNNNITTFGTEGFTTYTPNSNIRTLRAFFMFMLLQSQNFFEYKICLIYLGELFLTWKLWKPIFENQFFNFFKSETIFFKQNICRHPSWTILFL